MKRKPQNVFQPGVQLYFTLLVIFAVATFFIGENKTLALIEAGIILLAAIYSLIFTRKRNDRMLRYIDSVMENMDSATKSSLAHAPLPVVIFSFDTKNILWSNGRFRAITGEKTRFFEVAITDIVPDFSDKWLFEGKNERPELVVVEDRSYRVFGSLIRTERELGVQSYAAITYWVDVTEYADIQARFEATRPVTAIILLDNYDELLKNTSEKEKASLLADIDERLNEWIGGDGGLLFKYDRDRYFLLCEEQGLAALHERRFTILENVRKTVNPGGIAATVSIGIGKGGATPDENFDFAALAVDMALSRGGDQVVIKNRFGFEFFGGHTAEVEKRTKVKSRVIAGAFGKLVDDASSIFIMGHKSSDYDTVGAAAGIVCIARARGKRAGIVLNREDTLSRNLVEKLERAQEYQDVFITAQTAILEADSKSLLVVVDTSRPEQVESQALLESCNRVAVIDHHRRAATYIENAALNFHEPYASSAAELVTEMLQYLVDQSEILRVEAEALLAGIILDTKSFAIRSGSRTFEAAAFLRRAGADTTDVKRMMQSDFDSAMARFALIQGAQVYRSGIAVAVSQAAATRVVIAQAADELLNIAGVQASFTIATDLGGDVFISARSLGTINVQVIVEMLGGGGNLSTAGAQLTGQTTGEVLVALKAAIDKYLDDQEEIEE